jgi:polygalacturonase
MPKLELNVGGVKQIVDVGTSPVTGTLAIPFSITPIIVIEDALNLKILGAKGDGKTDDLAAITSALATAKSQKKKLYIPPGVYLHSNTINIDSVDVFGAGDTSELVATNPMNSTIGLRGQSPAIRNIKRTINTTGVQRQTEGWKCSITAWETAVSFIVENISIYGAAVTGVLSYGGKGTATAPARISNCRVYNTLADAIHMTHGSQQIIVENCFTTGNGDDGIAVVSYRNSNLVSRNITIRNNSVSNNYWGRGIAVVGGEDVLIEGNTTKHTECAGIYICSETSWQTFPTKRVTVRNNKVDQACMGTDDKCRTGQPGILVWGQAAGYTAEDTLLENNIISNPSTDGIRIGENTNRTTVKGNSFSGIKSGFKSINVSSQALNVVVQ